MPAIRCISRVNIQGWEPVPGDGADANLARVDLPACFDFSAYARSLMNKSTASTTSMAPRRQVPSSCAPSDPRAFTAHHSLSPFQERAGCTSIPMPTSSRSAAAAGKGVRARSSTERKIARKLAENASYIPRPKNSFILFRTDFVARRSGADTVNGGRGGSTGGDGEESEEEAGSSLSKQASAVWNKMSAVEKQPWVERAEHEKREHAAKYPDYRYRPVRQGSRRKAGSSGGNGSGNVQQASRRTSPETMEIKQEAADSRNTVVQDLLNQGYRGEQLSNALLFLENADPPAPIGPSLVKTAATQTCSSSLVHALVPLASSPVLSPSPAHAPPVSLLNLSAAPHVQTNTLPPIPRSPSAPIFDTRASSSTLLQPQPLTHHLSVPSLYSLLSRPASCPSTPRLLPYARSSVSRSSNTRPFGCREDAGAPVPSPFSSTSSPAAYSLPPSPESKQVAGADYFRGFMRCDVDDGADEDAALALMAPRPIPAGPATFMPYVSKNMSMNRNEYYERYDTNLDMPLGAFLPSVPEQPEAPKTLPMEVSPTQQQPLEAVAALWAHDQSFGAEVDAEAMQGVQSTSPVVEQGMPQDPTTSFFTGESSSSSACALAEYERALDTIGLFSSDAPTSCAYQPASDFFNLDLELELGCTSVLPESALSFSALGGDCAVGYGHDDAMYGRDYGCYAPGLY